MKRLGVVCWSCLVLLCLIPLEVAAQPPQIEFGITPGCAAVGTPVTVTAESTLGGQFYKYWVNTVPWCEPGSVGIPGRTENWQIIQNWSGAKTATWTPAEPGIHTIVVWVSNVKGDQPCDFTLYGQLGATYNVGGTNCTDPVRVTLNPSSGVVNQPVTVTAQTNGTNVQYRFWVNNENFCTGAANWTLLQDWTTGNSFTYTPTAPGIYTLVVWAVTDVNDPCPPQGGMVYEVPDGPALYEQNCASCHGPLATSNKRGASAAAIQTAINNNVGSMLTVGFLIPVEVNAIATALAP